MIRGFIVAGVVGVLVLGTAAAPAIGEPGPARDLVYTDRGPVRGVVAEDSRMFKGIPYAAPPVGDLRWRPPQPVTPWREPRDASKPGSQCAQAPIFEFPGSDGEDCLYLNVFTPPRAHGHLPVMVWIHGGFFAFGSGGLYDGRKLAAEGDVIVVTFNYRIGALGFLALPGLTGESPGSQSGNYGLQDQQTALRWVQRNIAAFGGDSSNVTLFGESTGAVSVCAQLVSPDTVGLFHHAIGQSSACTSPLATAAEAERGGTEFAAKFGCTDPNQLVACMRGKPTHDMVRQWKAGTGPVVGGREVPVQPADALRTDAYHHMPILMGNNLDEMRLQVGLQYDATGKPVTAAQYEELIRGSYGPSAEQVLQRYPVGAYSSPSIALATVRTHEIGVPTDTGLLSTCDHLTMYQTFAARPRAVPVYAYQFADRTAPPPVEVPGYATGAEHAVELNFVFPNLFGPPLNSEQQALSSTMVRYWTNFAKHGNPNGDGTPFWPRFRSSADVLSLDIGQDAIHPVDIAKTSNCDFWASLPR
jgi:para-nitrobenzyl esterase